MFQLSPLELGQPSFVPPVPAIPGIPVDSIEPIVKSIGSIHTDTVHVLFDLLPWTVAIGRVRAIGNLAENAFPPRGRHEPKPCEG